MQFEAIVFDFDLTLVDSTAGFDDCHDYVMTEMGLPHTPDKVRAATSLVGTPIPDVVRAVFPEHAAIAEEYAERWQARADEVMTGKTVVLPGAAATVLRLQSAGLRLAIVSQKRRYRIEELLTREHLLSAFETLIGAEDVGAFKPDPRGIELAIQRLGASVETAMYVGDTAIDAEAARRAGVPFIAVLTGFAGREDLAAYQPLAVLPSVAELPAFLSL